MDKLTCFPDYRIPQLFIGMGVMKLSPRLRKMVDEKKEILAGSEDEIAIRCATVQIVERMRVWLAKKGVNTPAYQLGTLIYTHPYRSL